MEERRRRVPTGAILEVGSTCVLCTSAGEEGGGLASSKSSATETESEICVYELSVVRSLTMAVLGESVKDCREDFDRKAAH